MRVEEGEAQTGQHSTFQPDVLVQRRVVAPCFGVVKGVVKRFCAVIEQKGDAKPFDHLQCEAVLAERKADEGRAQENQYRIG